MLKDLILIPDYTNKSFTGATIPIGIAVGRQRLQETSQTLTTVPQLQSKDLNRFNMGLDLGKSLMKFWSFDFFSQLRKTKNKSYHNNFF